MGIRLLEMGLLIRLKEIEKDRLFQSVFFLSGMTRTFFIKINAKSRFSLLIKIDFCLSLSF